GLVFGLAKGQPSDYVRRTQARTAPHFAGPAACLCLSGQKARVSTSNTKLRNPMPERNSKLARDARQITIRGAREHNLKNVDVAIPRDSLVVFTGLSGSGKSSLAFDTIYAEGQRRYVESLSAYARQFLGQMEKPDVDQIDGLSPAISIDQKGASRNPRSTVGTITEIYDYLRLLFARIGHPHCPNCGREIQQQTVQEIVDAVQALPDGSRIMVLAPIIKDRKGEHTKVFEDILRTGYVRVRSDGTVYDVDQNIELERYKMHTIEVVVDRLVVKHRTPAGELQAALSTANAAVKSPEVRHS